MLESTGIEVRFGGVVAVAGVSLSVGSQEILGLVGPNGSGKSTFLNAITGVVSASGAVTVDGRRVPLGRPGRSRAAGILRTFQTPQVYDSLSCLENVMLSMRPRRWMGLSGAVLARPLMLRAERQRRADARAVLERIGIGGLADSPADGLSYGQRRILELARAWAGRPQVLLLDEPSSGLNDEETREVGKILAGFRSDGMTLLVVDHKIDFVSALCDRVAVLSLGSVIAEGEPADVWENRDVIDAYLGVEGA